MPNSELDQALTEALKNDEFVFYYQPKISLLTGEVSGAEALLRWIKPDGQLVPPGRFIPTAEASGFIREISLAMFDKLIADKAIVEEVSPGLMFSFNLTAMDFETPAMARSIHRAISSSQIEPQNLQVELTETALIKNSEAIRHNVLSIVDMGVCLAMDDFGTGYSSIDILSQWPFSVVKLHQGLIGRVLESKKSMTIVKNSIHMAHQLGLKVVAEGIETAAVYDFLVRSGCTEAQGFWMGRPMPLEDFLAFLQRDERWAGSAIGLIHMVQVDHLEWRRRLIDKVLAMTYDNPDLLEAQAEDIELAPENCHFGQWYYGLGKTFEGIKAYAELELPHRQTHELAHQLITTMERGGISKKEVISLLRQVTEKSSEVLTLLQDLELEALLKRSQEFFA